MDKFGKVVKDIFCFLLFKDILKKYWEIFFFIGFLLVNWLFLI